MVSAETTDMRRALIRLYETYKDCISDLTPGAYGDGGTCRLNLARCEGAVSDRAADVAIALYEAKP